jgi:hypothetical protein
VAKNKKIAKRSKFKMYTRFSSMIEKGLANKRAMVPDDIRSYKGWDAIKLMYSMSDEANTPINALIIAAESRWETTGMNALFLRQVDVDALMNGKYTINKLPKLLTPFPSFTLCLPSEFEVRGIKPGGVLVSTYPDMDTFAESSRQAYRNIGINDCHMGSPQQQGDNILTLTYMDKDGAHNVMSYLGEQLEAVMKARSYKEFKGLVTDFKDKSRLDSDLSDAEKELHYVLLKIIVSLSVYAMAREDAIVDGFPKVKGFALDKTLEHGVKSSSLTASFKKRASPQDVYRTWFIRQLSHEKYYQGEYANWQPNSRFVFVEDTLVNSSASPKSLNLQKER